MHTKHHFVSSKADGTDATLVKPTAWNADHDMTTDADGVVLGRSAGAGAGPVQELPFAAVLPYGTVLPFAGATSPSGWLVCDGSSLVRATYPGLFAAIGTAYGAVDGAHFNIPDLRGRTIAGLDPTGTRLTGATISPDGNTLGGVGGAQTEAAGVNVGSWGGGTFSAGGYTSGSQSVNYSGTTGGESHGSGGVAFGGGGYFADSHTHNFGVSVNTGGENLSVVLTGFGASGVTNAVTNVQPTLLMNWIIKT